MNPATAFYIWFKVAERADWAVFLDVRATFGNASMVPLDCGITTVVFNIGGNKYRLATRIEYQFHVVYVKMVLTHREYDSNRWKEDLCRE